MTGNTSDMKRRVGAEAAVVRTSGDWHCDGAEAFSTASIKEFAEKGFGRKAGFDRCLTIAFAIIGSDEDDWN